MSHLSSEQQEKQQQQQPIEQLLTPVPLYLCCSVDDLNRQAEYAVKKVVSVAADLPMLLKLFNAAEECFYKKFDEERAYILYMRMLLLHNRISAMPDYKKAAPDQYCAELLRAKAQVNLLTKSLADRVPISLISYRNSTGIDQLRGLETLTCNLAIADREQPAVRATSGGNSISSEFNSSRSGSHRPPLIGIKADAVLKLLTRKSNDAAPVVIDLRSQKEKEACGLKYNRLVCLDSNRLMRYYDSNVIESLVPPDQLALWREAASDVAQSSAPSLAPVLVLAWHQADSNKLARNPIGCAALLCGALSSQPLYYLSCGLEGLVALSPSLVTDPDYKGPSVLRDSVSDISSKSNPESCEPLVPVENTERGKRSRAAASAPANVDVSDRLDTLEDLPNAAQSVKHLLSACENASLFHFDSDFLQQLAPLKQPTGHGLTGLRNLGNSCYANCVLQCLSNTPPLTLHFLTMPNLSRPAQTNSAASIGLIFTQICRALWSGTFSCFSPTPLLTAVSHYADGAFDCQEQQDAQEFLLYLLDGLHEALKKRPSESTIVSKTSNQKALPHDAADVSWNSHRRDNDSIIADLFQGQLRSTLTCEHCKHSSAIYEAFMYCSLPVVNNFDCSLSECLAAFLQPERLSGSCQWVCPACKAPRDAVKQLDIWRLPPCLLVHLKRFRGLDGGRKISSMVRFPLAGFDFSRFHRRESGRHELGRSTYKLYAVCNHYGSSESGHYTAFCLNAITGNWHRFDDDVVSRVEPDNVVSSAAYILFYQLD